ncbi:glutamyl-trna amidotransferase subunit a [Fusarium sporotrichioides]|uniref:Glutamyl-trna amidotransferase subunit a n=1 Tax=Fusarium sporotrichioides TaxID=5514 RepID=A0A395RLJ5_FUSSP|nr:glutamyl-trna amidotransferase subunit a [Fusarium sporotrichioides]
MTPVFIIGLICISGAAASVSRQIQLGDIEYFVPPEPVWKLQDWNASAHNDEFTPLTVVELNDTATEARISHALKQYEKDDVWTKHFTNNSGEAVTFKPDYNVSEAYTSRDSFPAGPYFVHRYTGDVYQAYRLYVDTSQAFIQSTYQDPRGTHHPLRAGIQSAAALTIAVPSRLYFTPTTKQPLAGLRIGIKDLFDMKGVKTSFGNRAWYDMSQIKTESAIAVQKLIDAGAVIVGKNKLSEFAFAGPFVTEHIDYLLPFNPRADGYQSPSDSSGGSAAAVASYDWLDASLGSDTGGSVRGPASSNGVHGGRPTQDAVNLTGALPLSVSMDTAGILVRDPLIWSKINKVLYDDAVEDYDDLPSNIFLDPTTQLQIEDFERDSPQAAEAVKDFLEGLSKLLSVKPKTLDFDSLWRNSTPEAYKGRPLGEAVSFLYTNLTVYEQWTELGQDFVDEYRTSHDGAFPYVVEGIRERWLNVNETYTQEIYEDDLALKTTIEDWVDRKLLSPDSKSCSKAVYIYISVASLFYKPDVSQNFINPYIRELIIENSEQKATIARLNTTVNCNSTLGSEEACEESTNSEPPFDDTPAGFSTPPNRLASVAGIPDYAISLGAFDMGSFSNATLQNQTTPVSISIMAGRGCDFVILDIVEALHKKGLIREVKPGAIP